MSAELIDVGEGVSVEIVRVAGARPGPTLALLGHVHGDEPEGMLAIRRILAGLVPAGLAGTVVAAPVANPPAALADTRESPLDGRNLARVFPGRPDGTVTERIAHALVEQVIAGADLLVDLHSAGRWFEMPFFAGFALEPAELAGRAEAAAMAFGTPLVWRHEVVTEGRSLSAARQLGVPAIYVEASGGGTIRGGQLDAMVAGVRRVMALLGMTGGEPPAHTAGLPAGVLDGGDGDTDAALTCSTAGYCVLRAGPGDVVEAAQPIAEILDPAGTVVEVVRAPRAATLTYVCRRSRVAAGDGIVMLGAVIRAAG